MRTTLAGIVIAALAAGYFAAQAVADDPTAPAAAQYLRVSTAESLRVRNERGEDLGHIRDVVVDLNTGTVRYLALDFGGFLGIGDKLFAVPWNMFKYHHTGNDECLMLNIPNERLRNAPGFDKNRWSNMGDPRWASEVDAFYHPRTAQSNVR